MIKVWNRKPIDNHEDAFDETPQMAMRDQFLRDHYLERPAESGSRGLELKTCGAAVIPMKVGISGLR